MATIGIYNYNVHLRGGGERKTAVMAEHFSQTYDVILITHHPIDVLDFGNYFNTDLSRVKLVVLADIPLTPRKKTHSSSGRSIVDSVQSMLRYWRLKALHLDIFINNIHGDTLPSPCRRSIYMCMFPEKQDETPVMGRRRLLRKIRNFAGGSFLDRIKTYSVVTANSHFTSYWISQLWHCPSKIIFSTPGDMGPPAKKEKIILNVGRIAKRGEEDHAKRQEILINVFKEMTDLHNAGWTLHFVGSVEDTPKSQQFLTSLQESAIGYPIEFHCSAPNSVLRDLYRRAAIYWHATGYGFPADIYPNRQEHLGLTPLEAMSAGVIPIVINSGGLLETVNHGHSGFRWNTLEELQDFTRRVAYDLVLQETMSQEAIRSLKPFTKEAFLARMDRIIESLLTESKMDFSEQDTILPYYSSPSDQPKEQIKTP